MDALDVRTLLETPTVELHDVCCPGLPAEPTEDEFTGDLRLVFPYRAWWPAPGRNEHRRVKGDLFAAF